MSFAIKQFYLNPKYYFDFSYKIQVDLSNVIEREVLAKSKRLSKTDWYYSVIITSERKFKSPKLSEADIGKKSRQKTMSLTLPYDAIKKAKEPVVEFCRLIFGSIESIVANDYEIDPVSLNKARDKFLKKVEANPVKYYDEC